MIGKRKVPTYRRRIFLYFMAIAIVPLLVLGFYSYHSAVSAVRDSIRQSNRCPESGIIESSSGRNKKDAPFSAVYLHASYCNDCGWEKQR